MNSSLRMAGLCAAALTAAVAWGQLDPTNANYSYEANALPTSSGFVMQENTPMGARATEVLGGGIFTLSVNGAFSPAADRFYVDSDALSAASDVFTFEARAANRVYSYSGISGGTGPFQFDLFIPRSGGGNNTYRIALIQGLNGGLNPGVRNALDVWDGQTMTEVDDVLGLDVYATNIYRIVGTGGGAVKIYVNNVEEPVFSETMPGISDGRVGLLEFGTQVQGSSYVADLVTDYIRVATNKAFDACPLATLFETRYDGNEFPDSNSWAYTGDSIMLTNMYESAGGGVFRMSVTNYTITDSEGWGVWYRRNVFATNATDRFTVDCRVARPVLNVTGSINKNYQAPQVEVFVPQGGGNYYRIALFFGDVGGHTPDLSDTDCLWVTDGSPATPYKIDGIRGLNVNVMNTYRIVGTGGGAYHVYVNDIQSPVYPGTALLRVNNDSRIRLCNFGWQLWMNSSSSVTMGYEIEHIYVDDDQALDQAPMPPKGTIISIK